MTKIILTALHEYNQNSTCITIICSAMIIVAVMITAYGRHNENVSILAAISDKGCNPHKQLHIEQKNIQIKDTYVKWNK